MALEDKIGELITALNANTAALSKIGAAASAKAGATGTAAAPKPAAAKPAAAKAPVLADIQKAFGGYLTVEDADEREIRKANVAKINAHFEVDRISNADPSKFAEALALLKQYEAGEDPLGGEEATEEALV